MARSKLGHIVALGGGGFSMEPEKPLLDDFILSRSRRKRPLVLHSNGKRGLAILHRTVWQCATVK